MILFKSNWFVSYTFSYGNNTNTWGYGHSSISIDNSRRIKDKHFKEITKLMVNNVNNKNEKDKSSLRKLTSDDIIILNLVRL
jgi:histone acetyltransferase (RNA polymerase elongator complex component)